MFLSGAPSPSLMPNLGEVIFVCTRTALYKNCATAQLHEFVDRVDAQRRLTGVNIIALYYHSM